MYNTTETFDNAILGDGRKFTARIRQGDVESIDSIKTLQLNSQNVNSECLTIGGAFSTYISLELWNPGFTLENAEFQIDIGIDTETGETEWCPLGYYTTETIKTSIDGLISVTAYDRIYSKLSGAFFSKLTYPADAIDVVNEISQLTGIEIDTSTLSSGVKINPRKVVSENDVDADGNSVQTTTYEKPFNGYTYRESLGYIAMLFCKYAITDGNGTIKFVWYQSCDRKITADFFFDDLEVAELAFSVGSITCNTGEETLLKSGSGETNIQLENPIMTQQRLDYIYQQVEQLQFVPLAVSFYGDIRLELGDVVTVQKSDGTVYNVPVMSVSQDFDGGLKTKIQCYGGTKAESTTGGTLLNRLERQYTELLLVKNLVGEKANFEYVYSEVGEFKKIKADYGEFKTVSTEKLSAMEADITTLNSTSITTDNLKANVAEIGVLTADEINSKYATIENLNATDGKIENLESKSITTENLEAETAKLGYLEATKAELEYAKIKTLETDYLKLKDLSAETAKLGYLDADEIDTRYARVDFLNVGTQVVQSSMIVDGAVTNEKVGNLSANKITSGTIDASKIKVTNLDADNITVGTINGKLIGSGSVDLDKLSEEVPTKEYLDKVQNELQGQIDGAIETFTKTEIPTLNNEPASLWTDDATKKKHIGDICYVVNPTSSADGYCYRFADLGTASEPSYSWVLIKDSDVTKALQDIIDINGEITGIKKFDSEISSWKTDTDSELSSLKSKTTTLETEMGTKVETSTFNTLKQTVDDNSSKITSLSNTVKSKADGSTVTELTNTVNEVKQTATSNSLSITSMKSDIESKADGKTVTDLSNRTSTLEQDLSGFKTTVSETYTTKDDSKETAEKVTSLETRVTQTEESITSQAKSITEHGTKISTLEQTAQGFTVKLESVDKEIDDTKTAVENAQNTADEAKTDAATAQTTADTALTNANNAQSSVDNLEIGGRNLLSQQKIVYYKNSAEYNNGFKNTVAGAKTGFYPVLQFYDANSTLLQDFGKFTKEDITALGKYSGTVTYTGKDSTVVKCRVKHSDGSQNVIVEYYDLDFSVKNGDVFTFSFNLVASNPSIVGGLLVDDIQVERGNKATDWTPAPEDVDKDIDDASKTATNYLNFDEKGLVVGDMTASELGRNVHIDSDSVDIRNGEDVLASFAEDLIELGNNTRNATIRLLKGLLEIIANTNTNSLIGDNAVIASSGTLTLELKGLSDSKYADVSLYKTPLDETAFGGTVDVNVGISAGSADTSSSVRSYEDSAVLHTSDSGASHSVEISGNLFDGDSQYCPNAESRVVGSNGSTKILQYDDHVEFYKNSVLMAKYNGANKTLWSGKYYMIAAHTITLSEAISTQPNGIVLVFSKYLSSDASNAYYWNMFFVPKSMVSLSSGRVMTFPMFESEFGNPGTKALYLTDTTIKGNDNNTGTGTKNGITYNNSNYVLRYVIGV